MVHSLYAPSWRHPSSLTRDNRACTRRSSKGPFRRNIRNDNRCALRSTFRPDLLRVLSPTAPAIRHRTGRLSLGGVAPRWRWLLVTLAALAVSCVVPGFVLSQTPPAGRAAVITGVAPAPSSECAAVSCNRGSSSSTAPLASVSLAGTIAAAMLVLLAPFAVLRARRCAGNLPAGTPSPLLRPPQHLVCA